MSKEIAAMTVDEVLALPVVVDLPTAGRVFGLGRTKAHELVRQGEFPCTVLRLGRAYKVPRADILRVLGISDLPHAQHPGTGLKETA